MKLDSIRDPENLERHVAILCKRFVRVFRRSCDSKPIFVLGKQRSGTSMLMRAFHRHPNMLVYDEHRNNPAFLDYRLRSYAIVRELIAQAYFPAVCFKSICDSHLLNELYQQFPNGHFIWAYRNYQDVANSTVRKFEHATRAIKLVCNNQAGGGWFEEGISPRVRATLRETYRPDLSDFDLACLVWWARNQILLDSGLVGDSRITVIKYEALVSQPSHTLRWLFRRVGIDFRDRVTRNITPQFIGRHSAPKVDEQVQSLCINTMLALNNAFCAGTPPDEIQSALSDYAR